MSDANEEVPGFSESWLSLREPADHAARDTGLTSELSAWARQQDNLHVVELGAGTGSNLRFLLPRLGHNQHWVLVDNDATLLKQIPRLLDSWASNWKAQLTHTQDQLHIQHDDFSASINWQIRDLANELQTLQAQRMDLLVGSALLDLTSAQWLNGLSDLCNSQACACLFALNYNGTIQWQPELDSDACVSALLNAHQLGNKGFGDALGPNAGNYFAEQLQTSGRLVFTANSPWKIAAESKALLQAIVDGWAPAAIEQDALKSAVIERWHKERLKLIEAEQSQLSVGHVDVLSLP